MAGQSEVKCVCVKLVLVGARERNIDLGPWLSHFALIEFSIGAVMISEGPDPQEA